MEETNMNVKLPPYEPELIRDETGRVRAMHVRVRPGMAVRAVQPNPKYLVYFYLGTDGLPVGLKFLEPIQGVAASFILSKLVSAADGTPQGVSACTDHVFFSYEDLERALPAAMRAIKDSREIPACAPSGG